MSYYEEIGVDEFYKFRSKDYLVEFSDFEISRLRSCKLGDFTLSPSRLIIDVVVVENHFVKVNIYIYKLADEWYIVYDALGVIYKCDQMEGLIKCLNDI